MKPVANISEMNKARPTKRQSNSLGTVTRSAIVRELTADGSHESTPVLLASQHEDGEDELSRHEHLDEEALSDLKKRIVC